MTASERVCDIEGCGRKHLARGWCTPHYDRWRLHGDPQAHVPIGKDNTGKAVTSPCPVAGCDFVAPSRRALAAHRGAAHRREPLQALPPAADGWQNQAACVGADLDLFFVEKGDGDLSAAKALCAPCPVRIDCLSYAIASYADFGVWGGLSPQDRRSLRRRSQAQAREKVAS